MNEGQLARALTAGNAWWREREWERDDRDLRGAALSGLDYEPVPLENVVPDGLYVLRGPRRVGKSVELKRAIARLIRRGVEPRRIIHFACDELGRGDLQRLVKVSADVLTRGLDGPRYWFLDEITSVQGWPESIKWLRDNTTFGADCVVLTGSSARDLADSQKALAGRLGSATPSDRLLLPMGFRRFACLMGLGDLPQPEPVRARDFRSPATDAVFAELAPWLDALLTTWELYLQVGGFPRAVSDQLHSGQVREDFIQALWDVTAGEAIRGAGTTAAQAQAMLARLTRGLGSPLPIESVRRDMGVASPHTAKARLQDLVFAYLAWPCHQRDGNRPKLSAQSKYYLIDPLMARLAPLRSSGLLAEADASLIAEQQLGLELIRNVEREAPGSYPHFSDVMYQRTSTKEVDFTGPRFGRLGFESKYVDAHWKRAAVTVRAALGAGVVVTRGLLDTTDDIWAVPAPFAAWVLNA
jgi:predicted AAA+ superfamily ATPase